jgi:predicted alpha/beta hydrolase family esterase
MRPVLLVPGIGNSGPDHWQSLWERTRPDVVRVMQRDWENPVCDEWVETLHQAVARAASAPILVGHSLGCLAIAHWAARYDRPCFAALLVAIPDPRGPAFPAAASGFASVPAALRKHRVTVVSSNDDPYTTPSYTAEQVAAWDAEHLCLLGCGHINAASGLGDWPVGWALVERWLKDLSKSH